MLSQNRARLHSGQNGAILRKEYGMYSYWSLHLKDGRIISALNLRKKSPELAKGKINSDLIVTFDKTGYSIKIKSN